MRLVSGNSLVDVSRRSWPLAGLGTGDVMASGNLPIELVAWNGRPQLATYKRIYRENPWVYAATQTIIRGITRQILKAYSVQADGSVEWQRSDLPSAGPGAPTAGVRLAKLLAQPEPGVSQKEWLRKVLLDWLINGNGLAIIDRDNPVYPSALWHTSWNRVTPIEGENVPILAYKVTGARGSKVYDAGDVLHFGRGTDIDSPIGLSPIAPLRYTIALHDAVWRHLVRYFENSARPSGMVSLQPNSSEATIQNVRETVRQLYSGPENAGKVLVTSGTYSSMANSPTEAGIVELAKLSREEIAAAYNVPPVVLGILDHAIKSNVGELRSQLIRDVTGPKADEFAEDLIVQLSANVPVFSNALTTRFDATRALRPDPTAVAEVVEKTRSALTPDEQRDMFFDKPAIDKPGSDTVWMPSGQIGLGVPIPAVAEPGPDPAGKHGEYGEGAGAAPF